VSFEHAVVLERQRMFSKRSFQDPEENSISRARRHAENVTPVLDLTVWNPTLAELSEERPELAARTQAALVAAFSEPENALYDPQPLGDYRARTTLARDLTVRGHDANPERMFLTTSTSEAYSYLFKLLCDPGDEVLAPEPSYPLFDLLAPLDAVTLRPYPLFFDDGWRIDFGALEARIGPRTKALLLVSPNNPTGHFLRQGDFDRLLGFGLPLLCDEVFETYVWNAPHDRARTTRTSQGLVFSMFGLSKQCALPQMKLAWTCVSGAPPLVAEALRRLELVGDTYLSVSTPVQHALPALLELGVVWRSAIMQRARTNLQALHAAIASTPIKCLPVEGGIYVVLRLPRTQSAEDWVLQLIGQGLYVLPGSFFGMINGAHVVLSLLTQTKTWASGLEILVREVTR
jgi:alanine-synthesizing transaminase